MPAEKKQHDRAPAKNCSVGPTTLRVASASPTEQFFPGTRSRCFSAGVRAFYQAFVVFPQAYGLFTRRTGGTIESIRPDPNLQKVSTEQYRNRNSLFTPLYTIGEYYVFGNKIFPSQFVKKPGGPTLCKSRPSRVHPALLRCESIRTFVLSP